MKIRNTEALGETKARVDALQILDVGLSAIDTDTVLRKLVRMGTDALVVADTPHELPKGRLLFVGIGKCAISGAHTIEAILGDAITEGIAVDVSMPAVCTTRHVACIAGTHPLPSDTNVSATKKILELLRGLTEDDLVLLLISGGGSTLLCQPHDSMICADETRVFEELTRAGAPIGEMNIVRRHLSKARGGGLTVAAHPARVVSLIFSDVPGDDLPTIASGPTTFDASTVDDARAVLKKYHVALPDVFLMETPKDGTVFKNTTNVLALSNMTALRAMAERAQQLGYVPTIVTNTLQGEARHAAEEIFEKLRTETTTPAAHFYGGETTVTIVGSHGEGGRNLEVSLGGLPHVRGNELLISVASDGHDNTDAAGAFCDVRSRQKAEGKKLDATAYLSRHDAYTFFKQTGDLIETGPTGSNVSDLIITLSF